MADEQQTTEAAVEQTVETADTGGAAQAILDGWDGRNKGDLMDRYIEATGALEDVGSDDADTDPNEEQEQQAADDAPAEETAPPAAAPKVQAGAKDRVVHRLTQAEARIVELERENRELKVRPAPQRSDDGDYIDIIRSRAAAALGCEPDDPRVMQELERAGGMIVAELAGDVDDPTIRETRRNRAEQKKHQQVQAQIDELKREREAFQNQALRSNRIAAVVGGLQEYAPPDSFPYTYAAEGNSLAERVLEGVDELLRNGYVIKTEDQAREALEYVTLRMEEYHRSNYERLSAAVAKRGGDGGNRDNRHTSDINETKTTGGTRKDGSNNRAPEDGNRGAKPRTVSASGMNGGRVPPAERSTVDSDGRRIDPIDDAVRQWDTADRLATQRARRRD